MGSLCPEILRVSSDSPTNSPSHLVHSQCISTASTLMHHLATSYHPPVSPPPPPPTGLKEQTGHRPPLTRDSLGASPITCPEGIFCCFLGWPVMTSCRNFSGRYASTWAGSIQIKPQPLGRMRTESAHRTGL